MLSAPPKNKKIFNAQCGNISIQYIDVVMWQACKPLRPRLGILGQLVVWSENFLQYQEIVNLQVFLFFNCEKLNMTIAKTWINSAFHDQQVME